MKIVTAAEMARVEKQALQRGADEASFMEVAGRGVAAAVENFIQTRRLAKTATFMCGKGNNSGDAYVAASMLRRSGFKTSVCQLTPIEEASPLCKHHYREYVAQGGAVQIIETPADCIVPEEGVIVDGLFGTGFHGVAEGHLGMVIEEANRSGLPILAIDIPSGLSGNDGAAEGPAICATETIFLGLPKSGFFLRDGWNHVGRLRQVDFGLDQQSVDEASSLAMLLNDQLVKGLMPPLVANRHKYNAGLVVGWAGSPGMPGAAMLACQGSLRSGAGLVQLLHEEGMQPELATAPYEVVRLAYQPYDTEMMLDALNSAKAAFIGPGLGRSDGVGPLLVELLAKLEVPTVLDGDALYWMAEYNLAPPPFSVLTPHTGEAQRLLQTKKGSVTEETLQRCQQWCEEKCCCLVLKGGPSFIFFPDEEPLVSPRGDPGMATGGSGDVLTGVIAALLAQGLHSRDAAALGVYLHGVAGELAAEDKGSYSMLASDIVEQLPAAFRWN